MKIGDIPNCLTATTNSTKITGDTKKLQTQRNVMSRKQSQEFQIGKYPHGCVVTKTNHRLKKFQPMQIITPYNNTEVPLHVQKLKIPTNDKKCNTKDGNGPMITSFGIGQKTPNQSSPLRISRQFSAVSNSKKQVKSQRHRHQSVQPNLSNR